MLLLVIFNQKFIFRRELTMDSVDSLGGLLPVRSSLEEKQRAAVMKVAFKTLEHFFGDFPPSVLRCH
jgi:hypothetical protein